VLNVVVDTHKKFIFSPLLVENMGKFSTLKYIILVFCVVLVLVFVFSKLTHLSPNLSGAFAGRGENAGSGAMSGSGHGHRDAKLDVKKESNLSNELFKDLILKLIDLYFTQKNKILAARLISEIDDAVTNLKILSISERWDTLTLCLAGFDCEASRFFDMISAVALEGYKRGFGNGKVIVELLKAQKYWGSDNVVVFSKALTFVDQTVEKMSDEVKQKWNQILDCDGKCTEENTLYMELIKALIL